MDTIDALSRSNSCPEDNRAARKRKRVHFVTEDDTQQLQHRVHFVPRSEAPKIALWVQRSEILESYQQAQEAVSNHSPIFGTYVAALFETYFSSPLPTRHPHSAVHHVDSAAPGTFPLHPTVQFQSTRERRILSHDSIQRLSIGTHADVRGLETFSLPIIGQDRARRRAEHTQSIVQLYQTLKGSNLIPSDDLIAHVSSTFTKNAVEFAAVLGLTDASCAFMDYLEALQEPKLTTHASIQTNTNMVNSHEIVSVRQYRGKNEEQSSDRFGSRTEKYECSKQPDASTGHATTPNETRN